ncbi:GNAT family N-acetyltransferase [Mobilicoccus pelagius]|nr:GNAT family N-acetyltransferase [Mobilicoccus pelagius]
MTGTPNDRGRAAYQAGWRIRHAHPEDARVMGRVHVEVWREAYTGLMRPEALAGVDPEIGAQRWARILAAPRPDGATTWVGCTPTGEVVALASEGPARDADAPTAHEVRALNVLRSAYGTGLADLLMVDLAGDGPAYLWVVEGNDRAVAFYRRHGFEDDGGRKVDERLGVREIRMGRERSPWAGDAASDLDGAARDADGGRGLGPSPVVTGKGP